MINEMNFRIKKDGTPYKGCFCRRPELIENYDKAIADTTQTWDCHHRLELMTTGGVVDATKQDLIDWESIMIDPPKSLFSRLLLVIIDYIIKRRNK